MVIDGSQRYDAITWTHYEQMAATYRDKVIIVRTKTELGDNNHQLADMPTFAVSAQTGSGMNTLKEYLSTRVAQLYQAADTPFVLNRRHIVLLEQMEKKLTAVAHDIADDMQYELCAAQLHDVLALVTELAGHTITERVMDTVFPLFVLVSSKTRHLFLCCVYFRHLEYAQT